MRNAFVNPLPGVPDVESPFFEELFSAKEADAQTMVVAEQLREQGYAVIDFPEPEFDDVTARIRESLAPDFDIKGWRSKGWEKGDGLRLQDAWRTNADVQRIATNPAMIRLLSDLYGRQAFPFQTLNFPVSTQQSTHSDNVHFSSVPERFMCGVWVAFEDMDDDNGPLQYFPGSHKLPSYVNEHIGACSAEQAEPTVHYARFEALWGELIRKYGLRREVFKAKKGQALIWAANLLHGGSKQRDPMRTRWSQVTHYYFEDCTYYTPVVSDPFYGKTFYRDIVDVNDGTIRPNMHIGRPVPAEVITRAMPDLHARKGYLDDLPADFDPVGYLKHNPDVDAAGVDAAQHYVLHGMSENRRWKDD